MKKGNILIAVIAVLAAASVVKAEEIKMDFDGGTAGASGYSALLQSAKQDQNDNMGFDITAREVSSPEDFGNMKELPGIRAVLRWPDGRFVEGIVACSRGEGSVLCAVKADEKNRGENFLLGGLVRNLMSTSGDNKHNYHNWSGPQLFSCTDVCREKQVLDRVETEWTKECNGSVSVSASMPSAEAGCTISSSEKKIYRIERECYTHECVCVKNCY